MTATNHALTGTVIGLSIAQPWLALPIALISHFVCDVIPHFGFANYEERQKRPKLFKRILVADAIILAIFTAFLLLSEASWLVFACLVLAGSPDFVWAYRYIFKEKFGKKPFPRKNLFSRFHSGIQASQTIFPGFYIELAYGMIMLALIIKFL